MKRLVIPSLLLAALASWAANPHLAVVARKNVAVGGFTPADLSPVLWLSDTGADTGTWPDISGEGNDFTQTNETWKPAIIAAAQNGLQVRRFDGILDTLEYTGQIISSGPGTCFVVFKVEDDPPIFAQSSGPLVDMGTSGAADHIPYTDGTIYSGFGSTVRKNCGDSAATMTNWMVLTIQSNTNDWELWINRTSEFSTASNTIGWGSAPRIGSSELAVVEMEGDIAEIILVPSVVSDANRTNVWDWLESKWAL